MCYLYCMPYSIDFVSLMLSLDDYHDNPLSFIQLMRIRLYCDDLCDVTLGAIYYLDTTLVVCMANPGTSPAC